MVWVFDYTDFRIFLSDFYEGEKSSNKNFSHRYIARRIGLKSRGHFSQILSGKTNISIGFIDWFTEFLLRVCDNVSSLSQVGSASEGEAKVVTCHQD